MPILGAETVSWTRRAAGESDDLGHPALADAAGFPRSVTGSWQESSRSAKIGTEGASVRIDADFFSETWTDGRVGDVATRGGVEYVVVAAARHTKPTTSAIDHAEYAMARVLGGAEAT